MKKWGAPFYIEHYDLIPLFSTFQKKTVQNLKGVEFIPHLVMLIYRREGKEQLQGYNTLSKYGEEGWLSNKGTGVKSIFDFIITTPDVFSLEDLKTITGKDFGRIEVIAIKQTKLPNGEIQVAVVGWW